MSRTGPNNNATDLTSAIKEALSRSGALSEIKGKLRSEVFKTIEDKSSFNTQQQSNTLPSSSSINTANRITSALVQEYLAHSRLECSLAVFRDESSVRQDDAISRNKLIEELGLDFQTTTGDAISTDAEKVPLLLLVVQHLLDNS